MPAPSLAGAELRRSRVGASEVAALVPDAFHPYATPLTVYARLSGLTPRAETSNMRNGALLEPAIGQLAGSALGLRLRLNTRTYIHRDMPLAATPDYLVLGERALLEVKLAGDYGMWADLPEFVEWQARAQLACTGRDRVHVAALVGSSLRTFVVERDEILERRMLDAIAGFWLMHVDPGVPPAGDEPDLVLGIAAPLGTLGARGALGALGDALAAATIERRAADRREDALRDQLSLAMAGAHARLLVSDGWRAEVRETAKGLPSLRFVLARGGDA